MARRVLLSALLALLATAAPAAAAHRQTTLFEAPHDLLDPATRPATLDTIQRLGVDTVRVVMYWRSVAPSATSSRKPSFDARDPAGYAWGQYDALLDEAKARGLHVLLTVSGPVPRWATAARKDTLTRPSPTEFTAFMTAVGRHFAGRVQTWSIWNEPNQPQFLLPQYDSHRRPVSPGLYRALYRAGVKGLGAAGVSSPRVLIGETSPRGTGKVVAPLAFLRGTFCLTSSLHRRPGCGRLTTAGVAHHAYTTSAGPRFVPSGPDDVTIGVLNRLVRLLDRAGAAGAVPKGLPVALTEFGIQSTPDPVVGVSLQRQNEYRALSERIAYENPRVTTFSQYLLRDDPPVAGVPLLARYPGFESGLETAGGTEKPSFAGFRLVLSAVRGRTDVSLWGRVRLATGVTQVAVQQRAGANGNWRAYVSRSTSSAGTFTTHVPYVAGRQYRLTWTPAGGTRQLGPATRPVR